MLVAPDSFKGTFRAAEVAGAIGRGLERAGVHARHRPLPARGRRRGHDGRAAAGARRRDFFAADVHDPLGPPAPCRSSPWSRTAARRCSRWPRPPASGWSRKRSATPGRPRTYGTGELICRRRRRRRGGDPGRRRWLGHDRRRSRARSRRSPSTAAFGGARIVVLTDVRTPFERAPRRSSGRRRAPTRALVARLEERLDDLAGRLAARPPRRAHDRRGRRSQRRPPGGSRRDARASGAPWILDALGFDARMRAAARRRVRRGQAGRADARGQAGRRDRHPHSPGQRTPLRQRGQGRARRASASASSISRSSIEATDMPGAGGGRRAHSARPAGITATA